MILRRTGALDYRPSSFLSVSLRDAGARLDFSNLLHHVMARGIEGGLIFRDTKDREEFLSRLSDHDFEGILEETCKKFRVSRGQILNGSRVRDISRASMPQNSRCYREDDASRNISCCRRNRCGTRGNGYGETRAAYRHHRYIGRSPDDLGGYIQTGPIGISPHGF